MTSIENYPTERQSKWMAEMRKPASMRAILGDNSLQIFLLKEGQITLIGCQFKSYAALDYSFWNWICIKGNAG
jgi:hypothetical protein